MNKISRYFATAVLILLSGRLAAQKISPLEKFYSDLENACMTFTCTYLYTPAQDSGMSSVGSITGDAYVELQGEAYIYKGNGLEITCDGNNVCIVDESVMEAVYEPVPETITSADMIQNPVYLLKGLKNNFKIEDSQRCEGACEYVLVPTVSSGIEKCLVMFADNKDGLSFMRLNMSDGSTLRINLSEHDFLQKKPDSHFVPRDPVSFGPSWVVTDLR